MGGAEAQADRGALTGAGEEPEDIPEMLATVLRAADLDPGAAVSESPGDPLGLVALVVETRLALLEGDAVLPGGLGALAGVTGQQVRHLARAGELSLEGGSIKATEAKRWLGGRGVPGFAGKKR